MVVQTETDTPLYQDKQLNAESPCQDG